MLWLHRSQKRHAGPLAIVARGEKPFSVALGSVERYMLCLLSSSFYSKWPFILQSFICLCNYCVVMNPSSLIFQAWQALGTKATVYHGNDKL